MPGVLELTLFSPNTWHHFFVEHQGGRAPAAGTHCGAKNLAVSSSAGTKISPKCAGGENSTKPGLLHHVPLSCVGLGPGSISGEKVLC